MFTISMIDFLFSHTYKKKKRTNDWSILKHLVRIMNKSFSDCFPFIVGYCYCYTHDFMNELYLFEFSSRVIRLPFQFNRLSFWLCVYFFSLLYALVVVVAVFDFKTDKNAVFLKFNFSFWFFARFPAMACVEFCHL